MTKSLEIKTQPNVNQIVNTTRSDAWILNFQKIGFNNSQWYYDNLNETDRKNIRLAIDYAIPRDKINDNLFNGLSFSGISSILPSSGLYLDNVSEIRKYNLTKASQLLSTVFVYQYNSKNDDPNTPYDERQPYFIINQVIPDNNALRIEWATYIHIELAKIGIYVEDHILLFDDATNRLFSSEDYYHGGFDNGYIGWNPAIAAWGLGLGGNYLPYANLNTSLWTLGGEDSYLQNLLNKIFTEQNGSKRDQYIYDFQQYAYDNALYSIIRQSTSLNFKNNNLIGLNNFTLANYENWDTNGNYNITIASQFDFLLNEFNPL